MDVPAAVWCACWCLWFLSCFCNNLWLNLEITGILHSCPDVGLTYNTKCLFELQTLSDAKSKSSSVAWPKCNRRTLKSWSDCWAFCWCYKKRPHCCLLDMTRSFVSSNYAPGTTSGMFVMGLKLHQYSRRCNVLFLTTLRVSYWNCLVLPSRWASFSSYIKNTWWAFCRKNVQQTQVSCMFIVCARAEEERSSICFVMATGKEQPPSHSCGPRSKNKCQEERRVIRDDRMKLNSTFTFDFKSNYSSVTQQDKI